jgi:trehalose-6-phosphatase
MGFHVAQVRECLAGFDYPGTSAQLADHARDNGAEPKLVDTLRALKKDSVDGPEAVMSSLSAQNALGG